MIPTNYKIFIDVKKLRNGFQYEVKQSNVSPGERSEVMDKGEHVIETGSHRPRNTDIEACRISNRTPIDEAVMVAVNSLFSMQYNDVVRITLGVDVNPPPKSV